LTSHLIERIPDRPGSYLRSLIWYVIPSIKSEVKQKKKSKYNTYRLDLQPRTHALSFTWTEHVSFLLTVESEADATPPGQISS